MTAQGQRQPAPDGYLGAEALITSGPAPQLVTAGYEAEIADAPLLHHGLNLADLAHVMELYRAGVIASEPTAMLLSTLLDFLDTRAEAFPYDPLYGDPYNSRERELQRRIGTVAGQLHTGRTRREAGRIAFRIALRVALLDLHQAVGDFVIAAANQAASHAHTLWADMTYLQPAQPSTFGHYVGCFGEESTRHLDRIERAYGWADRSPAGVGGVGGSLIPIDRARLSELLGFASPGKHTRDAMWATDGLADSVVAATQAATTVDRLAEDLEIFASPGFSYVTLDASVCRASVLMPQKRNPYALAVIRSGAGTLIGRATSVLVTQRTPSARTDNWLRAYRDTAEAIELARQVVALGAEVMSTMTVHSEVLAAAAGADFTASADLAEQLVMHLGLDYRSSYRLVGKAVARAAEDGRNSLTEDDLACAADEIVGSPLSLEPPNSLAQLVDPERIVLARTALGGSAPGRVLDHSRSLMRSHAEATRWRDLRRAHLQRVEDRLIGSARILADRLT